jgi:tetratricopeptide (TPR) repeat protein
MTASRPLAACCAAGSFALILLLGWLAYRPGLNGGFLFDDFVNLPALGYYGRVDNWTAFWLYLTSGSADPTGRPIALLSFLIDSNDWPADPYSFKRTGVLLHLLNGAVLTWLLLKLGQAAGRKAALPAVLGAALWLLHPYLVSTTLYVVQRETVLECTFVLIGLLGYVCSRELAANGRALGVWLAALSISACTALATLSKANGILLPLLALVIETVLLAQARPVQNPNISRAFASMVRLVLILPSLLFGAFLAWKTWSGFVDGMPSMRTWTLGQRLLTETRVLMDYLGWLWLPRAFSPGLFNDTITVSTSLFSPISTALCTFAIIALLAGAWRFRSRYPALSLAILFYFAGHLLESTVIPLELYFEHRNYLPAVLLFWALALWLCAPGSRRADRLHIIRLALSIVLPFILAALTFLHADLWGNVRDQMVLWASRNPDSPRAQATVAQVELARGEIAAATVRLQHALKLRPEEIQLALNLLSAKCAAGALTETDVEETAFALRTNWNVGRVGSDWFSNALNVASQGNCKGLSLDVVERLLKASAENPRAKHMASRFVQDRLHMQARIAILRNENERALELFDEALDADPNPGTALEQAAILAAAGQPALGLRHLDHLAQKPIAAPPTWSMQALHAWLMNKTGYWENEIAQLRATLEQDIVAQKAPVLSPAN